VIKSIHIQSQVYKMLRPGLLPNFSVTFCCLATPLCGSPCKVLASTSMCSVALWMWVIVWGWPLLHRWNVDRTHLNRYVWTGQGQCHANLFKWGLSIHPTYANVVNPRQWPTLSTHAQNPVWMVVYWGSWYCRRLRNFLAMNSVAKEAFAKWNEQNSILLFRMWSMRPSLCGALLGWIVWTLLI